MTSPITQWFGTDGIRGRVGDDKINPQAFLQLGWAVGHVLAQGNPGACVLIGKDPRISGYMLESSLEAGLSAAGMETLLLGPMPTPAVAYLTATLGASAGMMITASHNSYTDNGIKFFAHNGCKLSDRLQNAINQAMSEPMRMAESHHLGKARRIDDAPGRYIEFCKSRITAPFERRLTCVIDCANGATYHIAPSVFSELGANVIPLHNAPNGLNINDHCGSTHLAPLRKAVLHHGADVGIAFDGDGDRCLLIDHEGSVLDGDDLLWVLSHHPEVVDNLDGVVGTHMSNSGLPRALEARGIQFERANVGDRYVRFLLEQKGWFLGGEPSGHVIHAGKSISGDGIITALLALETAERTGTTLADVRRSWQRLPHRLINLPCHTPQNLVNHPQLQAVVSDFRSRLGNEGSLLVRPSGTEPTLRLHIEAASDATLDTLQAIMVPQLQAVIDAQSD